MNAAMDFEQAGELKIGQVGVANLRVRTLDVARLGAEMRDRVARAPKLFARAAVIVDFGGLAAMPDAATARALIEALCAAGVLPVALAYGSSDNEKLAVELGLPLLSKFRAQYEPVAGDAAPAAPAPRASEAPPPPAAAKAPPAGGEPGTIQTAPVRSGQQVYAENRDLTVLSAVGAGAEVIADGSIHIYGPLRGRALAGAQGNEKARIFCRAFHAELVAVAGHYKVLEDIPKELHGKPVQVWLDHEELKIAALD
ncbi:septum site-determining protein MinC [Luteimonas marina]|uniref:Probable septum site-determining protein MinC n=1 Tax=Luteimonas marina TaxID=488485 RepID=A0A5C5U666_9GAMM|nr:septum site-determining protein MinC [Luteimonas marina]TWT21337.1 septum site-determining protein MinC [Luteimonas marina]